MASPATKRPLPVFAKWPGNLWAFAYAGRDYFTTKEPTGWCVVPADDEKQRICQAQPSKAAAVRLAMDRIDQPDRSESGDASGPTYRGKPVEHGTSPGGKVRHIVWGERSGKCGADASGPDNPQLRTCGRCSQSLAALERRERGRRRRW